MNLLKASSVAGLSVCSSLQCSPKEAPNLKLSGMDGRKFIYFPAMRTTEDTHRTSHIRFSPRPRRNLIRDLTGERVAQNVSSPQITVS